MAGTSNTWLLTWNPEKYAEGGDGNAGGTLDLTVGTSRRWNCGSSQPVVGDAVYLVRLGSEPRGIIARGTVSRAPFNDADWSDPSRQKRYIEFAVDAVRQSCGSGLMPMLLLTSAMSTQTWSPQQSGIQITEPAATQLAALWKAGEGTHSLRQFADWCDADRSYNVTWLPGYREATALARSIQADPSKLDAAALQRLWRDLENGVSSVSPGGIPHAKFAQASAWLTQITHRIGAAPDQATYADVMERWKADGGFETTLYSVVHRVFAAFAPECYTTVLNAQSCKALVRFLRDQFQLIQDSSTNGDWFDLNASIKKAMAGGGLDPQRVLEDNIAIWRVLADQPTRAKGDDLSASRDLSTETGHPMTASDQIPLNQILYGPPGTGKTHHAITKALEILAPALVAPGVSRQEQVNAFNAFLAKGSVVFCTFHQSFAYEDFVEGLRAEVKNEKLVYEVSDGIFKALCEKAAKGLAPENDSLAAALASFDERLDAADGERLTLKTVRTGKEFDVSRGGPASYRIMPRDTKHPDGVYRALLKDIRAFYEHGDPSRVHNGSYVHGIVERLRTEFGLQPYVAPTERARFVIVIDEINRGNVSRIFGELITLIEASKREGAEGLKVTLPYSKESFSVPDNVYLLGTMNTADKSLATVDLALRRRFHFIEMPPEPELLDEVMVGAVDIGKLLRTINQRIEVLLDRDHCIGHAIFMPLKADRSLAVLQEIFQRQVLPLLQEYFFEDWQRIAWVLNDHRKPNGAHRFLERPKADVAALFGAEVDVPQRNLRWKINADAFGQEASYLGVIYATLAMPGAAADVELAA